MLYSLYQKILDQIQAEFSDTGLDQSHFGFTDPGNVVPFFLLKGKEFDLKNALFKPGGMDILPIDQIDQFVIPDANAIGKFQYKFPVSQLSAVVLITAPGTENETAKIMQPQEYTSTETELTLTTKYPGGTVVKADYRFLGYSFSDRFTQSFSLVIKETDKQKLEQYSLLAISVLWSSMPQIIKNKYTSSEGSLRSEINISDLQFDGQTSAAENPSLSVLNFTCNGIVSFVKAISDGYHVIDKVNIGNSSKIVADDRGVGIEIR
jgi:hypothetical protein